jgi:large subunit ribosomal protein L21
MSYAVIQLAGKQYKVTPGEILTVNKLPYEAGEKITISDVLLASTDAGLHIGAPLVAGATVTAVLESQGKGEKIRVATYRSKSRTRKVNGHRQLESKVSITAITVK